MQSSEHRATRAQRIGKLQFESRHLLRSIERPAASQNPGPSRLKHPPRAEPARPSGLDHRTRKQVSRGRIAIEDRIDLHGMRQAEAHAALRGFILSAVARRLAVRAGR